MRWGILRRNKTEQPLLEQVWQGHLFMCVTEHRRNKTEQAVDVPKAPVMEEAPRTLRDWEAGIVALRCNPLLLSSE
jgi:hypothetical protein